MLRRFGVTAAVGVMIAYVVTIAFLPPVLSFFAPPRPAPESAGGDRLERLVIGLTRRVLARRWAVIGGGAVLLGLALFATTIVEVDTSLLDSFEEGDPAWDTTRLVEAQLDGIRPLEVILRAEGAATFEDPELVGGLDATADWLRAQPGVLRVTTASDYLHEVWALATADDAARADPLRTTGQIRGLATLLAERDPDPLRFYLSEDARTARVEVKMADVGAAAIMDVAADLDRRLARTFADHDVRAAMTGDAYTGSVGLVSVVDDLLDSLGLAVLIIFGTLTILFRSVRLGLLSIPPNGLPLLCTVGWMVVRGIPLNIATAIIFSISIGLAVDGTIHVLARFREERGRGRSVDDALLAAAGGTGRAIVVSSLTLVAGFSVLFFSSFVPVRYFGELIAVTVASCLVATLVLQPALLRVGAPRD
jgi:predicted RND superfamily exporter protein